MKQKINLEEVSKTMLRVSLIFFLLVLIVAIGMTIVNEQEVIEPETIDDAVFETVPRSKDKRFIPIVKGFREIEIPERQLEGKELYISYIDELSKRYDIVLDLNLLIQAMMQVESNFQPDVKSYANCIGLMQVSPRWHTDRAHSLGVDDLWDPYGNTLVGIDILDDLYHNYAHEDIVLAVMMYNMDFSKAKTMYANGQRSQYAIDVFRIFEELKEA